MSRNSTTLQWAGLPIAKTRMPKAEIDALERLAASRGKKLGTYIREILQAELCRAMVDPVDRAAVLAVDQVKAA